MAQDFGDTPGLRDAAHRAKGRLGLEDLADRAESCLGQVSRKGFEHAPSRLAIAMAAQMGIEAGSEKPRPDEALAVGGIAGTLIATIGRLIALVLRAQGAKPIRGQQPGAAC